MTVFVCFYESDASKGAVLRKSALSVGGIDKVISYDAKHPLIKVVKDKVSTSLEFAWCYYRPYVIHFTMFHYANDEDVVIYCDEQFSFTGSVKPYLDRMRVQNKNMLLFRGTESGRQAQFCKQDCFDVMQCSGKEYMDAHEISPVFQVYQKSEACRSFVNKYVEFSSDPIAMDSVYRTPNTSDFIVHHRDQSVLTNLCTREIASVLCMPLPVADKKYDLPSILDTPAAVTIPRVVVVTPTTGTQYLAKCIESVQRQTLLGTTHLIVVDGPEHAEKVYTIVESFLHTMPLHVMVLPFPAGADGWLGHRIYASMAMLLDYDYIAYLDEDNFYEPDHLELLHHLLVQEKLDWTFSLRKILDTQGTFLTLDNCESLGNMSHTVLAWDDFLVDTSCYFLTKHVAQAMAPHWMYRARTGGLEADRSVCRFLLDHESFRGKGVPKHTLHYTVAQRADSVKGDFFFKGNEVFKYDFSTRPTVYIFLHDRKTTQRVCSGNHEPTWNVVQSLASQYNLVNGYAVGHRIPLRSTTLISTLTQDDTLPEAARRPDLRTMRLDPARPLFRIPSKPVGKDVVYAGKMCPLAQKYVEKLKDITVVDDESGAWATWKKKSGIKILRHTQHPELEHYTFALVVDSPTAAYDALIHGCIPLYYGDDLPTDMYIDLRKKFKTSKALDKYLDSLPVSNIQEMRDRILEKRSDVLREMLPALFAKAFDHAYRAPFQNTDVVHL